MQSFCMEPSPTHRFLSKGVFTDICGSDDTQHPQRRTIHAFNAMYILIHSNTSVQIHVFASLCCRQQPTGYKHYPIVLIHLLPLNIHILLLIAICALYLTLFKRNTKELRPFAYPACGCNMQIWSRQRRWIKLHFFPQRCHQGVLIGKPRQIDLRVPPQNVWPWLPTRLAYVWRS